MRRAVIAGALAVGGTLQVGAAAAATLVFDEVLQGSPSGLLSGPAGSSIEFDNATLSITGATGTIFIFNSSDYGAPVQDGGAFCAVIGDGTFGDRCTGGASIVFLRPVKGISFTAVYVGPGDGATVTAFAGDYALGSVAVTAFGEVLGLSGFEGVTRLEFVDASVYGPDIVMDGRPVRVGTGIAYTDFDFTEMPDPPDVTPVPLPAAGGLTGTALAVLALWRRLRPLSGAAA